MIRTKNACINPYDRNSIICWLLENIPRGDIRRILNDGRIIILGSFIKIPPTDYPGWIIKIISKNNQKYFVAITVIKKRNILTAWIVQKVPWKYYNGTLFRDRWCLHDGDHPKIYLMRKEVENERRKKEVSET